ncbi:MAG: hypothetical protein RLZZ612_1601 [Pseudomonadota bacterium]
MEEGGGMGGPVGQDDGRGERRGRQRRQRGVGGTPFTAVYKYGGGGRHSAVFLCIGHLGGSGEAHPRHATDGADLHPAPLLGGVQHDRVREHRQQGLQQHHDQSQPRTKALDGGREVLTDHGRVV